MPYDISAQYINPDDKKPDQEDNINPNTPRRPSSLKNIGETGVAGFRGFMEGLLHGPRARSYAQYMRDKRFPNSRSFYRRLNWLQRLFRR